MIMKKILTFMVLSAAMVVAVSCIDNKKENAAEDAAVQTIETKADMTDDCGGDCASCEHGCGNEDKACDSDSTGCDHKGDGCKKGDGRL